MQSLILRRKQPKISLRLYAVLLLLYLLSPISTARGHDIQITNLTVHPYSGGNGEVEFDITWSSSWRSTTEPYNWDAAWVFCKIRRNGGDWTHLKLNTTGHTIPSTPQAITTAMGLADTGSAHNASTNPAVGIFLYRTNDGFGTLTANDVRLQWSYADNGAASGDLVEIRVIGIEMVYIPQAAFYAGDNGTSKEALRQTSTAGSSPWYISSENAITTTTGTSGSFYYPGAGGSGDAANSVFTIPAAFPKGYAASYMMKGEISQGQWITFFNMLTDTQKTERDITANHSTYRGKNSDSLVWRNNISWTSGEASLIGGTHAGVAMNFLAWADLGAYLDWAGLRPMTELEFEKSARGPLTPVSGEYAWGSTSITSATSITNGGLSSERGQAGSNVNMSLSGPVRVGSFAKGVSTRVASGGGFYGVMELSGNIREQAVTIGRSTGRTFEGRYHGDGVLDSSGIANVTSWPSTTGLNSGMGLRGAGATYNQTEAQTSDRDDATTAQSTRDIGRAAGGRGVRSAP